jgi:hypothetical protein
MPASNFNLGASAQLNRADQTEKPPAGGFFIDKTRENSADESD